jgi:hypothetical protein
MVNKEKQLVFWRNWQTFVGIACIVFSFAPNHVSAEFFPDEASSRTISFSVTVDVDDWRFRDDLDSMEVRFGSYGYYLALKDVLRSQYNGTVVSFHGDVLGYFVFSGPKTSLCIDRISGNGAIHGGCSPVVTSGELFVSAPYFPNAKYIDLYAPYGGGKLLTVDVSEHSVCNENAICELPRESSKWCPSDCRSSETPFSLREDSQIDKTRTSIFLWMGIAFFFVIMGIIVWRAYRRRKFS